VEAVEGEEGKEAVEGEKGEEEDQTFYLNLII
jgi:hypothetical protein